MQYKILHCADLHLDSPLRGLDAHADAPLASLRNASRQALENLITLAIDEQVRLLLIAGDIFDGDWQDWHTGQFFVRCLQRLHEANIPVIAISGNHDAQSVISRDLRKAWPGSARLLSPTKPETVTLAELDLSVHGQSFATPAVTENLAENYPSPIQGNLNIGLLHTALEGRPGHAPYAPCTLNQLIAKGYDYWALGHIHQRDIVWENPWIVYPGNLQSRHINEPGEKGATLIHVENRRITHIEHRILDVLRWQRITPDLAACTTLDAIEHAVLTAAQAALDAANGRLLAARLELSGTTPAHSALAANPLTIAERLRNNILATLPEHAIWLERIVLATTPPATSEPNPEAAPLLALLETLDPANSLAETSLWCAELLAKIPGLLDLLPEDHIARALLATPPTPEALAPLLAQSRALIAARLEGA